MTFMYLLIKYRYSDILLKNINFIYNRLFYCNYTCYCVDMAYVTSALRYVASASRYHSRYQSRSSMYIRGLIPQNFADLAEAVPIIAGCLVELLQCQYYHKFQEPMPIQRNNIPRYLTIFP